MVHIVSQRFCLFSLLQEQGMRYKLVSQQYSHDNLEIIVRDNSKHFAWHKLSVDSSAKSFFLDVKTNIRAGGKLAMRSDQNYSIK